jgi:hypothetical protein
MGKVKPIILKKIAAAKTVSKVAKTLQKAKLPAAAPKAKVTLQAIAKAPIPVAEKKKLKRKVKKEVKKETLQQVAKKEVSKEKGMAEHVGSLLGMGVGSLFGPGGMGIGQQIGSTAGKLFKSITGWGDYRIRAAKHGGVLTKQHKLVQKGGMGTGPASFNGGGAPCVYHREFLGNIYGTTTFSAREYEVNPGIARTFPWLSGLGPNFQQYYVLGMEFYFESTSTDYSSTAALGSVIMSTLYNVDTPAIDSTLEAENNEFTTDAKPSKSFYHPIECDPTQNIINALFVRNASTPRTNLTDKCKTYVITDGNQNTNQIGRLWLVYKILFIKPTLLKQPTGFARWNVGSTNAGTTAILGITEPTWTNLHVPPTLQVVSGSPIVTMPADLAGHWMFTITYEADPAVLLTPAGAGTVVPYLMDPTQFSYTNISPGQNFWMNQVGSLVGMGFMKYTCNVGGAIPQSVTHCFTFRTNERAGAISSSFQYVNKGNPAALPVYFSATLDQIPDDVVTPVTTPLLMDAKESELSYRLTMMKNNPLDSEWLKSEKAKYRESIGLDSDAKELSPYELLIRGKAKQKGIEIEGRTLEELVARILLGSDEEKEDTLTPSPIGGWVRPQINLPRPPPQKDLTRYGIERNPGPVNVNTASVQAYNSTPEKSHLMIPDVVQYTVMCIAARGFSVEQLIEHLFLVADGNLLKLILHEFQSPFSFQFQHWKLDDIKRYFSGLWGITFTNAGASIPDELYADIAFGFHENDKAKEWLAEIKNKFIQREPEVYSKWVAAQEWHFQTKSADYYSKQLEGKGK